MIVKNNILLRNAPPLIGTEIAVYIDGAATEECDGFTFGITRIALPSTSDSFTIEWGDGSSEKRHETVSGLTHTYSRIGLYRVRICDGISNVAVSSTVGTVGYKIYAPMIREFRTTSTKIHTIARTAFHNAYNLQSLELRGSAVRTIAAGAFSGCRSLTSLEGCEQIEKLHMTVFKDAVSLPEKIYLPNLCDISAEATSSPFLGTAIKEFHFAAKHEDAIKALQIYIESGGNLGVEGAVCYFDL